MRILALILLAFSTVNAGDPTGREIMSKQKDLQKVKSEEMTQKMVLVDKSGKKEERILKTYTKETAEKDVYRTLLVFLAPSDIKGTALLTWQHKDQADDQWLYLPAQKKMQRIAKGSKKNYFMGTDFTYEDFQREDLDSNKYTLVKSEKFNESDCFVIEAVPSSDEKLKDSGYSKRLLWVTKDNYSTVKAEFYDKRGKLLKSQENRDLKQVEGSVWRSQKGLMDNSEMSHKTLVGLTDTIINKSIDDKIFTENYILSGAHVK